MFGGANDHDIARSLRSIDHKLGALLDHLGVDTSRPADDDLLELVRNGRKIEAIKLHRERTGAGLREAKIYVEDL